MIVVGGEGFSDSSGSGSYTKVAEARLFSGGVPLGGEREDRTFSFSKTSSRSKTSLSRELLSELSNLVVVSNLDNFSIRILSKEVVSLSDVFASSDILNFCQGNKNKTLRDNLCLIDLLCSLSLRAKPKTLDDA